jgi:hypothetical protein
VAVAEQDERTNLEGILEICLVDIPKAGTAVWSWIR